MSALRRVAATATVVLLSFAAGAPVCAAAVQPGSAEGASVMKSGWWWRGNTTTPLDDTTVGVPQPSSPEVPEGALPVAAVGGDPDKIAALEFDLEAKPGATVQSFTLVLQEHAEPGASTNPDNAAILACPITQSFWAHRPGARWDTKPAFDCTAAQAAGERDDTGLWTFDLTAIAQTWLTEGYTHAPAVVLVEDVEAPQSFQIAFAGVASDGVGVNAQTTPAQQSGSPLDQDDVLDEKASTTGSGGGTGISSAPSSSGTGGVGVGTALPDTSAPPASSAIAAPAPSEPVESQALAAPAATVPTQALSSGASPWYSGLPWITYVLGPLALGGAYLAMLALGPDAQPVAAGSAQRGVSRALQRLQRVGALAKAGALKTGGARS